MYLCASMNCEYLDSTLVVNYLLLNFLCHVYLCSSKNYDSLQSYCELPPVDLPLLVVLMEHVTLLSIVTITESRTIVYLIIMLRPNLILML